MSNLPPILHANLSFCEQIRCKHHTACAPAGVGVAAPRAGCAVSRVQHSPRDHVHAIAPRWPPPRGGAVSSVDDPNIRTWSVCVWHSKDVYLRTCVRNLAIF